MSADEKPTVRCVTERTPQVYGAPVEVTWAAAVLDDGTEIRMRNLGDRVEVRGWDPAADCAPPSLRVDVLGQRHHIVDVFSTKGDQ